MKQKVFNIVLIVVSIIFSFFLVIQIFASNIFQFEESIEIVIDTKGFNFVYNEADSLFKIVNAENKSLGIQIKDKIIFNNFLNEFFINKNNEIFLPKNECKTFVITTQMPIFRQFLLNDESVNILCR